MSALRMVRAGGVIPSFSCALTCFGGLRMQIYVLLPGNPKQHVHTARTASKYLPMADGVR